MTYCDFGKVTDRLVIVVLVVARFTVEDADRFLRTTRESIDLGRVLIDAYEPNKILVLVEFPSMGAAYQWVQTAAFAQRSERDGILDYSIEYFSDAAVGKQTLAS